MHGGQVSRKGRVLGMFEKFVEKKFVLTFRSLSIISEDAMGGWKKEGGGKLTATTLIVGALVYALSRK